MNNVNFFQIYVTLYIREILTFVSPYTMALTTIKNITMNNEEQVEILNTLIVINNDRIEGYETASEDTEESDLKKLFADLQHTSQKCKSELISEVQRLGGTPDEGTRITGKFFRVWMDVKAALTGNDRKAILNSCEYGENVAVETYDDALRNNMEELTSPQQTMLSMHQAMLKADHSTVKGMIAILEQA